MRRGNGRCLIEGLAIPDEAVASECGGVASVTVTDCQIQCHHRVATRGVGESMCRGDSRSLGERLTIPGEAVASECGGVTGVAVTNGQMQCHHGVATRGVGKGMCRGNGWSLIECLAIPVEAVASECGCVASVAVTDGQMQRHHRIATRSIGESMRWSDIGSFIIGRSIPGKAVAGESGGVTSVTVTNDQMQCDDRVATRSIGEGMRRSDIGSLIIGRSIPGKAVASECGGVSISDWIYL